MKHWCFYSNTTGVFVDLQFSGSEEALTLNTPDGCTSLEGRFDRLSQRVDLVSGQVVDYQPAAPADTADATHAWSPAERRWIGAPTLPALKRAAADEIDAAAGAARLRYITDVPGQQAIYLRKAEQATAFAAGGYSGAAPAYIQGEAEAMGISPTAAANRILQIAAVWDSQVGPAIEKLRIWGKNAVDQALDAAGVEAARTDAVAQLDAV